MRLIETLRNRRSRSLCQAAWYREQMHFDLSKRTFGFTLCVLASLIYGTPLRAQEAKVDNPKETFTGSPPAVFMHFFLACPVDKACSRTEPFRVDPVPKGCCVLTVTNGDGHGTDEVSTYEVFLNGHRVLATGKAQNAQASVRVLQDNTLNVVLVGKPHSKVFVLIAYDPRESK
jgi:hypothetical protein